MLLAEEQNRTVVTPPGAGTPLTQEELESSIGRYGEVEEIPEDFQFNAAESKVMAQLTIWEI